MHPKRLAALCLIAAGVIFTPPLAAAQSPATPDLRVDLKIANPEVRAQGPLTIQWTLTNTSGGDLTLLKWQTPLEGIRSNLFRVERNGAPALYLGPLVKRGAPTAEDVVELAPGGSVSATVDLLKAYGIYKPGDYTVQFVGTLSIVAGGKASLSRPDHGLQRADVQSSPAHFKLLEPRTPPASVSKALKTPKLKAEALLRFGPKAALTFDGCTAEQINVLTDAQNGATQLAAYSSLELFLSVLSGKPNAPYITWFGAQDVTRYNQVSANYSAIYAALAHQPIVLHCSDTTEDNCHPISNVIAFVYPAFAYDVYVCPLYWKIPHAGFDSQTDTLVHEVSHFNVVAKTDDYAYGAGGCMSLATTDPAKAIANADCYSYFADTVGPKP